MNLSDFKFLLDYVSAELFIFGCFLFILALLMKCAAPLDQEFPKS